MEESPRRESDVALESGPDERADDSRGTASSLGGPELKMPQMPKAPPPFPAQPSSFWERLWETEPPVDPLRLYPDGPWPRVRRFTPSFLTSALLQASIVFFLYTFPFALLMAWLLGPQLPDLASHTELKVVSLHDVNIADYLPNIKPEGAAKAPGRGEKPPAHPRLGASHFDPRITIVSNPPKPDNSLLTLKNETKPPSPKPVAELQVPDVVTGGPKPTPEAAKTPEPVPEKVVTPITPPPAPTPTLVTPPTLAAPTVAPSVVQLLPTPPKPIAPPQVPATPHVLVAPPPPPVRFAAKLPELPSPSLTVPLPPPPAKPAPPSSPAPEQSSEPARPAAAAAAGSVGKASADSNPGGKASPATASGKPDAGGGPHIMALSVNPVPLKDLSAIPGGVHNGEFSISPSGTLRGSPGGAPSGAPEAGEGGAGPGGDHSVAVGNGSGKPGGGGQGNPATPPSVSISGPQGGAAGATGGTLAPLKAEDLVYPVKPDTPKAHAPTMVVASGSFGGGGLRVFGVLHGGKIFTVYFPMPGKAWILQYCAQEARPLQETGSRVVMIQMAPPLTPPAVIEQSDFHRPPAAPGATNSMIILHGSIQVDGVVKDLSVVQGLDPISDKAAMLAFARWKFKPAERLGAPVAVEVLIGIP